MQAHEDRHFFWRAARSLDLLYMSEGPKCQREME